ncbi:MAG TPA: GNAT family N-acetyltransferase, partial [Chthonomonadales bacterium]|nr:GNAT family N-acetyltransferase [Chthonomonadales bacterium]
LLVTAGRLGVGGIYNVGVVPAARNQGIGRAISAAACVAAGRLGCSYVTLNSATHIYDRLGFRTVGYGQTWWLSQERLQQLPSREEVTFAEAVGTGDVAALEAMKQLPDLDIPLACRLRPIELAARAGKPRSIRWLISRGANLHVLDAWDMGWKEEARRILKRQPELANFCFGQFHFTPLHAAAMRGDEELAALLLTAKPDLTICDREYHGTPLGWARHFHRERIAAMIEAASQ